MNEYNGFFNDLQSKLGITIPEDWYHINNKVFTIFFIFYIINKLFLILLFKNNLLLFYFKFISIIFFYFSIYIE